MASNEGSDKLTALREARGRLEAALASDENWQAIKHIVSDPSSPAKDQGARLAELEKAGDDAPLYKSIGSLLIKQTDKKGLVAELEEQKETLEVRVKTLDKQEKTIKNQHQVLQDELTQALQNAPQ